MKVTTEYMEETTAAMVAAGFRCDHEPLQKRRGETLVYEGHQWTLTRGPEITLELQALRYPEGMERFYLRIVDYHGLESFSFELDSWKHWPDRVEFKYYPHSETGRGLSFKLWLHRPAPPSSPS